MYSVNEYTFVTIPYIIATILSVAWSSSHPVTTFMLMCGCLLSPFILIASFILLIVTFTNSSSSAMSTNLIVIGCWSLISRIMLCTRIVSARVTISTKWFWYEFVIASCV